MEVVVRPYGWNDFDASYEQICGHLVREWSRSVCDNPWAPLIQALPRNRFYLADERALDAFDNHTTEGREIVGEHLRSLSLGSGAASIVCDMFASSSGTRFCTAATRVQDHMIAVWTVWTGQVETPAQIADREGKAIEAFVRFALGHPERYNDLLDVMCGLRAPGSTVGQGRHATACGNHRY